MSEQQHEIVGSPEIAVVVTVTRSGGIAGLRREWRAAPPRDAAPRWIALIDRCPWDEPEASAAMTGADRFAWRIHACTPQDDRSAELSDASLTGPWRTLVDEVRAEAAR